MFDRDIFKALIAEIADTREVEIGCDECFEQLDRFVEMQLSGLNAAQAMPLCWRPCGRPEKGDGRTVSVEPG
jgi:hypothetical protein